MKVIISPYHRSVTIDGVEVRQKMLEFPNALNHLASISCTYDKNNNTVTELSDVHRYVSHFTEREYFVAHIQEFIDWYYAEKQAQIEEEARLQKYKEDVEDAIDKTVQAGKDAQAAILADKTEAISNINQIKSNVIDVMNNTKSETISNIEAVAQNSVNNINSARTNGISEIYTLKNETTNTINKLKTDSVNELNSIKNTAITSIVNRQQEAENSIGVRKTLAQAAVDAAGKTNKDTLDDVGTNYLNQTKEQVELAKEQVAIAKEAADKAVAISNVGPATRSQLGLVKIGRGLEINEEGLIEVRSSVTMLAPIVEAPDTLSLGYDSVFTMQAYPGLGRTSIKQYRCTLENVGTQIIDADEETGAGTVTFVVPRAIGPNKSLKLTVVALDTLNNESLPTELTRSTVQAFVNAPDIISPEESSTIRLFQGFTATSSSFETTALPDTHESTDWIIAKDISASVIAVELNGTSDLYSHTFTMDELVGKILPNQSYYVFARYNGELLGASALGIGKRINVVADAILPPNISSPEDYTVIYPTAGFAVEINNDFETDGIADTHTSTDWFITTDKAGNNIVASCMNSSDLKTHKFTSAELYNLQDQEQMYYVHARFHGRLIESSAKSVAVIVISKEALIEAPVLDQVNFTPVYPTGGIELSTSSVFISRGITNDTHKSTDWFIYHDEAGERIVAQAKNSSDLYSHVFPANVLTNMEIGKVYYVAARFNGEQIETGKLSQIVPVVTRGAYIHAPEIDSPNTNEEVYKAAGLTVTTSSIFRTTGATDRHISTDWIISRDIDGLDVVVSAINSPDLKQHTFTAEDLTDLEIDSYYYISIRFNGEVITKGTTSETVKVVVRPAFITAPVIDSPAENSDVYKAAGITVSTNSNFIPVGITDNHISSDWILTSDITGRNVIVADLATQDLKAHTFASSKLTDLEDDTTYYVFCRFNGRIIKSGNLSNPLAVVNRGAYIEAPTISSPTAQADIYPVAGFTVKTTSTFTPVGVEDIHASTDWLLCADNKGNTVIASALASSDLKQHTFTKADLTTLQIGRTYYLFCRFNGSIVTSGLLSASMPVIAKQAYVDAPTITSPAVNAIVYNAAGFSVSASEFATVGTTDTHDSTDWLVCFDEQGQNIVASVFGSKDLTTHKFTPAEISALVEQNYWLFVRYNGELLGQGVLSAGIKIENRTGYINKPSIISPNANITVSLDDDISIITSSFSCVGPTDTHIKSSYRLLNSSEEVIAEELDLTDLTSYTLRIPYTAPVGTCYLQVQHEGQALGKSEWSEPLAINVVDLTNITTVNKRIALTTSQTWTAPLTRTYTFTAIGGGGGGGGGGGFDRTNSCYDSGRFNRSGGGGGGGGAGYVSTISLRLNKDDSVNITIGAGGNGGSAGSQYGGGGGKGGTTSILIVGTSESASANGANGGGGGAWGSYSYDQDSAMICSFGNGGGGGAGIVKGSSGTNCTSRTAGVGGNGGKNTTNNIIDNINVTSYGIGGKGGNTGSAGAKGSNGAVLIDYYNI